MKRLEGLEVASCRRRPDLTQAVPDRGLVLWVVPVEHVSVVISDRHDGLLGGYGVVVTLGQDPRRRYDQPSELDDRASGGHR